MELSKNIPNGFMSSSFCKKLIEKNEALFSEACFGWICRNWNNGGGVNRRDDPLQLTEVVFRQRFVETFVLQRIDFGRRENGILVFVAEEENSLQRCNDCRLQILFLEIKERCLC